MKALLCTCTPVSPRLGASKVFLEAAHGYRLLGWQCTVVGPEEIAAPAVPGDLRDGPLALRDYLRRRAGEFDVVEYEHHQLPFPRATFAARPLLVARSVLLVHLQLRAGYLAPPTLRGKLGKLLKQRAWRARMQALVNQADVTLREADVVQVCNTDEREILIAAGHAEDKIVLKPFGLFRDRFAALEPATEPRLEPVILFIGTFDPRKGMAEFPSLVRTVLRAHPRARFRLLGTRGLVPDAAGVLRCFPRAVRQRLDVIPAFEPEQLPNLLATAAVGVFPSHCEGFPFAVLEQLAAGIPVFAYDAPGPPMMLTREYLVRRGDGVELGRRVSALLASREKLAAAQRWARARAAEFTWERSVQETVDLYRQRLAAR
jgi:glycosyltransferase involved in cell wall biosynthesis